MKITLSGLLLVFGMIAYSQNKGDSKIIITVDDTTGIYEKVKIALVKADFIVKDLASHDYISTHHRELKSMSGFAIAFANIKDGKVELNGYYTRKKISYFGVIRTGKDAEPIVYYKNGKLWPLLMKVAKEIGPDITYSKK